MSRLRKFPVRPQQEISPPLQNNNDYLIAGEGECSMARKDRSRRYLTWPQLIVLGVLLLAGLLFLWNHVRQETDRVEAAYEELRLVISDKQANVTNLTQQLERVSSDEYAENIAREKFDYIRKGEIVFQFDDPQLLQNYTEEEAQFILEEMRD